MHLRSLHENTTNYFTAIKIPNSSSVLCYIFANCKGFRLTYHLSIRRGAAVFNSYFMHNISGIGHPFNGSTFI